MSTSLPDPDELRKQAKKAQAANARKAKKEAQAAAIAKAERIAGMQKGKFDAWVAQAATQMKNDATKGYSGSRVHLAFVEPYASPEYEEAMEPIWDKLVEHFEQKYDAKLIFDYHTRYEGSMDPSPVPDGKDVYLSVCWVPR